ncbi:alpha/beta hydrolase [Stutzerimonas decontaminans]|uniref:Alpha/beta hydrolase n=2 Tax=Stutzerimonas TaxID=2901164 RepID=A0ABX4VV46_9GAMM|nr:alpha/beta family hydrolase [Stutzerimonas decontaminans]AHY43310.1 alpha/beta hydrolase [Stutzerimonas decontaminans]MCQ4246919.1 dienelactone hydrolase family protein [Stutzerimonas decontaminans]PNF84029.1 alpha/beta hydrolase [Stutzerimonas decontaminans]
MGKGQSAGIDPDQYTQSDKGYLVRWDQPPKGASVSLILAHGAGAPMDSPFMAQMAERLAARGVAVCRFEFSYMAARRAGGSKRPPSPQDQLLAQWREIHALVRQQATGPLAIGGKSMGGRMASLLADELGADALVCLGYPFYPAGKPDKPRVAHLATLQTPTLIVQGERDALGDREAVARYALSPAIELHWLAAADHDLKPLKRSGLTHDQHLDSAADAIARFLRHAIMQ